MSEFEDLNQGRVRVSIEYIRTLSMLSKVGLIFVHICDGLCIPGRKYVVVSLLFPLLHGDSFQVSGHSGVFLFLRLLPSLQCVRIHGRKSGELFQSIANFMSSINCYFSINESLKLKNKNQLIDIWIYRALCLCKFPLKIWTLNMK